MISFSLFIYIVPSKCVSMPLRTFKAEKFVQTKPPGLKSRRDNKNEILLAILNIILVLFGGLYLWVRLCYINVLIHQVN